MKKTYVLDTNVLLQDPRSIYGFQENNVVIPAVVIEEIDNKKKLHDEIGRNARMISRMLDDLRSQGSLTSGVKNDGGGTVRVEMNHREKNKGNAIFIEDNNDNRILQVAYNLNADEQTKSNPQPVVVVSMDAIVRIKADVLGIKAENYRNEKIVDDGKIYKGYNEFFVSPDLIRGFYNDNGIKVADLEQEVGNVTLYPNQLVILKDGGNGSAIAIYKKLFNALLPIIESEEVYGVYAKNSLQKHALELLLDDSIQLVTMAGKAGTGKTLLALAAALHKTTNDQAYKKILVSRPVVSLGKDIGFLPGDKDEKLRPWMQPIYDNLDYIFSKRTASLDYLMVSLPIEVEVLSYIRGRSIPSQYIIIDEAQNLSKHEIKTIITRAGTDSKVVLIGDPEQIDNPYLDYTNNGLSYVIEKFKDKEIAGHITLEKGVRSELARIASEIL